MSIHRGNDERSSTLHPGATSPIPPPYRRGLPRHFSDLVHAFVDAQLAGGSDCVIGANFSSSEFSG